MATWIKVWMNKAHIKDIVIIGVILIVALIGVEQYATGYIEKNQWNTTYYQQQIVNDVKKADLEGAVMVIEEAFESLDPIDYNRVYKEFMNLFDPIINDPIGRTAARHFGEVMIGSKQFMNIEGKIEINTWLGDLYALDYHYIDAIDRYIEVMSLSELNRDEYTKALALLEITDLAMKLNGYTTALEVLEGIDVRLRNIDQQACIEIKKVLLESEIYLEMGEHELALEHLELIKDYESWISEETMIQFRIREVTVRAESHIERGNFEEAGKYVKQLQELILRGGIENSTEARASYHMLQGKIYQHQGLYTEAIRELEFIFYDYDTEMNQTVYNKVIAALLDTAYAIGDDRRALTYMQNILDIRTLQNRLLLQQYHKYIFYKKDNIRIQNEKDQIKLENQILMVISVITLVIIGKALVIPKYKKARAKYRVKGYLQNKNYMIYYQPIIDPKQKIVRAFEGLIRLKKDGEICFPAVILSEIQTAEMMGEVTLWLLRQAIEDYYEIKKLKDVAEDFYVSINLSLNEVRDDVVYNQLKQILQLSGLTNGEICIEISESVGGEDYTDICNRIDELGNTGYKIAIDDFGVDYSNISILDRFGFDVLKLDKYFMDNLEHSLVVQSLILVAEQLSIKQNISIVAEGVEIKEQVDYITDMRSEKVYIQGYYYSKPQALIEFVEKPLAI